MMASSLRSKNRYNHCKAIYEQHSTRVLKSLREHIGCLGLSNNIFTLIGLKKLYKPSTNRNASVITPCLLFNVRARLVFYPVMCICRQTLMLRLWVYIFPIYESNQEVKQHAVIALNIGHKYGRRGGCEARWPNG